jgi:hypothetical protein
MPGSNRTEEIHLALVGWRDRNMTWFQKQESAVTRGKQALFPVGTAKQADKGTICFFVTNKCLDRGPTPRPKNRN